MAFTHSPGCMFVCDVPSDGGGQTVCPSSIEIVSVTVPGQVFSASVVSTPVAEKIRQLPDHSAKDELLKAACSLSHSHSVALALQSCLNEDELGGLAMLLCALTSCCVKTTVVIDAMYSHMLSHIQAWVPSKQTNEIELFVTADPFSAVKCDHVVVINKGGEGYPSEPGQPEKQHCILIGHAEKCHYTASYACVEGEPVVALCALAVSLALLQTCPSHVRYAVRGICDEPVQVKSVKDPFTALTKVYLCCMDNG